MKFFTLVLCFSALLSAQQVADPNFDTSVSRPAYTREHPRVVIDEAHHNFHTAGGRYKPFATLLQHDGYDVRAGTAPFAATSLAGTRVLVIANALGPGATTGSDTSPPAFTDAECQAVLAWVRAGGSLLLVSDHTPMGEANERLAGVFGVTMGKGFVMSRDDSRHMPNQAHQLVFSRDNQRLGDHPITRGRTAAERINTVMSFTGQSLSVPAGAVALLNLGPDAWEAPTRAESQLLTRDAAAASAATFSSPHGISADGRAQGVALAVGRGRVVILGEAAMMSAQVANGGRGLMGMNVPGSDDKQFALNVLHWLSGLLQATGPGGRAIDLTHHNESSILLRDLQRVARAERMTVAEWVRQTLRTARRQIPAGDAARKLAAIRTAAHHQFPTSDIAAMLEEIERGYSGSKPQ